MQMTPEHTAEAQETSSIEDEGTYTFMVHVELKRKLQNLLMRVKEESEKASLKLNVKKPKIMASSPITSWLIDGQKMETVTDFIFLGSKITADGDCLLLGRKAMTNVDSILKKQRHRFANKGPYSQSYGWSHVWMWKLDHKEGWTPKNLCFLTGIGEDSWESL